MSGKRRPASQAPHPLDLRGNLDAVAPDGRVFGWCWAPSEAALRRPVRIVLDEQPAVDTVADVLRDDLLAAGIGDGGHGFVTEIPAALRRPGPARARLVDAATGQIVGPERSVVWPDGAPVLPLAGNVDLITRDGWVSGWCWEPAAPDRRIRVDVLVDGVVAGAAEAAEGRADLRHAGVGDGRYGFNVMLPYELLADRGTVEVRVAEHGTGRPLGEAALMRIGRRAESEARIQELERQVTLLGGRLQSLTRDAERQPEQDSREARALFATVAGFFQDLADGRESGELGLRGGVGAALRDLRLGLPELALRPAAGLPLATIAVPADRSVEEVHAALQALRAADTDLVADIVLLDPAGTDPRCALLPALVANLRVGPSAASVAESFGRLLRDADTRLVGLVSSAAHVEPGWLAALVDTLATPGAALASAVAIRPDGLLHHAGLLLDADQRFRDPGHLAPATAAAHRVLRPVDAVAPVALLLDRTLAAAQGGLDPEYETLAAALGDLCLALNAAGNAVLRQPEARAVWVGPEATASPAFAAPDGRRLRLAMLRHARGGDRCLYVGSALVVDAALPRPDRDGGSVAALEQMLVLRRLGWRVVFTTAGTAHADPATEADRRRLERQGIELADPVAHPAVGDLLRDDGEPFDLIYLHRHQVAALLLPIVRELAPRARVVFAPADLHFLREAREADVTGAPASTARATREQEIGCARAADATVLLNDREAALLSAEIDPAKLHVLRWIARPRPDAAPFAARGGLLFVGHFRHAPNVDAVLWYAREIKPWLDRLRPGLVLDVVGADAPPVLRAVEDAGIRLHGWVAALDPLLAATRVSLAPLRYGAGFKVKVATSLAAGVPVVGTAMAFEGTGLEEGDGIVTADTPEAFARAIVALHDDEAAWSRLSARASDRVAALYSPQAADAVFGRLLAQLGLPAGQPTRRSTGSPRLIP